MATWYTTFSVTLLGALMSYVQPWNFAHKAVHVQSIHCHINSRCFFCVAYVDHLWLSHGGLIRLDAKGIIYVLCNIPKDNLF